MGKRDVEGKREEKKGKRKEKWQVVKEKRVESSRNRGGTLVFLNLWEKIKWGKEREERE